MTMLPHLRINRIQESTVTLHAIVYTVDDCEPR